MSTTATVAERPDVDLQDENAIKARLTEIQAELDEIGPTYGMNQIRLALGREKDDLLDALLRIYSDR